MLLRTIENIRQKPKAVRQRYAFVTAVAFTAIVTGIWSLSLPARFTAVQEGVITVSPEITTQTATAPFSGVWTEFRQQVLGKFGKSPIAPSAESNLIDTSTSIASSTPVSDSVSLPSGSTIRFGTQAEDTASPSIMLGTTSTTSSTSPAQP